MQGLGQGDSGDREGRSPAGGKAEERGGEVATTHFLLT